MTSSSFAALPDAGTPDAARLDLAWPWDAGLPQECDGLPDAGVGNAWQGWANVQYPPALTVVANTPTAPIYGQVWSAGETEPAGAATGWQAELVTGPYGSTPLDVGCWRALAAVFNVQAGNNDEYVAAPQFAPPGLFGAFYRYRPALGAWLYGDLNGSNDGVQPNGAVKITVTDARSTAPLVVVTLNLRCRLDDWPARRPLVVEALAGLQPDLVGFQEDCLDASGTAQSQELVVLLGQYNVRGYVRHHLVTHTATAGAESYQEGISVLSAWPLDAVAVLDLPLGVFPRKAIAADVTVRGQALRFYSTHLEFGGNNETLRGQQAAVIAESLPAYPAVVTGDFNDVPGSPAVMALAGAGGLVDGWAHARPNDPGLTFPASAPTRRIDFLLLSPALASGVTGAKALDARRGATWLSDHRGQALVLAFP